MTMNLGDCARAAGNRIKTLGAAVVLSLALLGAPAAIAQGAAAPATAPAVAPAASPSAAAVEPRVAPELVAPGAEQTSAANPAATAAATPAPAAGGYVPMKPTPGKGMPVDGGLSFQDQYTDLGEYALWMHDAI